MPGEAVPLSTGAASMENEAPESVARISTSKAILPPRWLPNGSRVPGSAAPASWSARRPGRAPNLPESGRRPQLRAEC